MSLRVSRRDRLVRRALLAVVLLLFSQIAIAASGCFSTRTQNPTGHPEDERCALEALLCRAHCQAQEQTLDPVQIPVFCVDELQPVPVAALHDVRWARAPSPQPARIVPPVVAPPLTILFARLLN